MDNAQILINCGKNCFEFSISPTGQLDYAGKAENIFFERKDYQKIASSTYFTPNYYLFLQEELNFSLEIFTSPKTDISDKDIYEYLLHIGALLCAVESRNSFLAGELLYRRKKTFEKFSQLTQFIIKPLAVEILFTLMYGGLINICAADIPLLLNVAKKSLNIDESKENIDQAFVRYFKNNKTTLSLQIVGDSHYKWKPYSQVFENLAKNLNPDSFLEQLQKIQTARQEIYENLKTAVQAEPYNPYDENAIAIMIEDIDSKLAGKSSFVKAG